MAKKRGFGVAGGFVLACCALATLFSFLGRFGWVFDLFSHFHLQLAVGLAAVAISKSFGSRSRSRSRTHPPTR